MKSFYITTTLPYVNAEPHIGFAMELIHADIIARWKKSQGFDVFFNTGTDEHGLKVYKAALADNKDPKAYTDELSKKFQELKSILGLSDDLHFIRTTDEKHKKAAQRMWELCKNAGYIEKKKYRLKYCVGCELEKTDSELIDGKCPIHPDRELDVVQEDNYFFKFSEFKEKLTNLYQRNLNVTPDSRLNEIKVLIDRGLEDFSISRLREKMPWGIPVPDDSEHIMYVWFDALVSYISTLGWPDNIDTFNKFWGTKEQPNAVQFAGKDQVRQQAAMWQAMLIAAGLPPTKEIVIHGFLNFNGQKMSKSLGNVINPQEMVERYGQEAVRAILAGVNQFEDTDVNMDGFLLAYNSNLADGLGNVVARVMRLAEDNLNEPISADFSVPLEVDDALNKFCVQAAINHIRQKMIKKLDEKIQTEKPWETKDKIVIADLVKDLGQIAYSLKPFMPETSEKILIAIKENKKPENLFPRLNA